MTPEEATELQARLTAMEKERDLLKTTLEQRQEEYQKAAKVATGYKRLKETNEQAAAYLDAIARGETPEPFWDTKPMEMPVDEDLQALEQRITRTIEQRLGQLEGLVNQKFETVGRPVISMQAQLERKDAEVWASKTYPGFDWPAFEGEVTTILGREPQTANDWRLAVKAFHADNAERVGYERAASELQERSNLEEALMAPQMGGADRGVDSDVFAEVDPTNMRELMKAQLKHEGASDLQLQQLGY